MPKVKSGISQVGGKFRLCNTILKYIPYHEFFLSMFCGACWVELNKPRSRYECYNDYDSEIINYLVMVERYPEEFDKMKRGVYGLVSQEICNRIVRGELKPRNDLERAYFFYYLNKLTFGGDVKKVGSDDNKKKNVDYALINNQATGYRHGVSQYQIDKDKEHAHWCGIMRPTDPCRKPQYDKIKKEWETKGYIGLIDNQTMSKDGYGRVDNNVVKKAKADYRGITQKSGLDEKEVKASYAGIANNRVMEDIDKKRVDKIKEQYKETVKASFAGINNTRAGSNASNMRDMEKWKKEFKETVDEVKKKKNVSYSLFNAGTGSRGGMGHKGAIKQGKASYKGIANHGVTRWDTLESGEVEKAKEQYQAVSYKGINPKTTRPYHNNDCGLLTPLNQKAIERLRYVNLTCYTFQKVYKLFYNAFHVRKGLSRECFVYADPPYPSTEKYYGNRFPPEYHQELIDLMLETPFNFMLSIGKDCQMYLDQLSDWVIVPVKVRYSTDATSQDLMQEYIIMNYEINDIGNMKQDNQSSLMRFMK